MVPKTITRMREIHLELRESAKVLLSALTRLIKIMRWAMEQFCDPSGNIVVVSSEQPSNKSNNIGVGVGKALSESHTGQLCVPGV